MESGNRETNETAFLVSLSLSLFSRARARPRFHISRKAPPKKKKEKIIEPVNKNAECEEAKYLSS
jgi:hypothetical protein